MKRRILIAALALACTAVAAHHGWSSFDQDKPIYLAGIIKQVRWQNPHAELIVMADDIAPPADLASRPVPAQQQSVNGAAILKKAQRAPATGEWELEFAPMSRMSAWGLEQPPKSGERVEVIGYALSEAGKRTLRIEYLYYNGKAYAFRSGPLN